MKKQPTTRQKKAFHNGKAFLNILMFIPASGRQVHNISRHKVLCIFVTQRNFFILILDNQL